MAALPDPPLMSIEDYLTSSFSPDVDYVDGALVERNVGTPDHSALQNILIGHFITLEKQYRIAVRPECRTRVQERRYRVPDVAVLLRPFRQTDRFIIDPPAIIIEILSPDDRMTDVLRRFRDYDKFGVRYIVQMDPEDRTIFQFVNGDLVRRDITSFDVPERGSLPFDSRELLAALDEE